MKNFIRYIIRRLGLVLIGVKLLPKDYPSEFLVTKHAQKRLMERINIRKDKIPKIIVKAWFSKRPDEISKKLQKAIDKDEIERIKQTIIMNKKQLKYIRFVYRELMGHLFVFTTRYDRIHGVTRKYLITVI